MGLADQVDADLKKGISAEDALSRLAGRLDRWCRSVEQQVERLETVAKLDKQNLDEVDKSVRQTWDVLDGRVKKLESMSEGQRPHQLGQ
ncbi:MAG: hypothetical protein GWN58_22940 [Anaerolineae bacterium]|nr:hypothetical protein [Thermoplasmata archaeon]NIV32232.1 hypothetical protein [Anaerolineae bacterium]NIY03684.1 hypothetical protein [Thermoplasmata archaeon]